MASATPRTPHTTPPRRKRPVVRFENLDAVNNAIVLKPKRWDPLEPGAIADDEAPPASKERRCEGCNCVLSLSNAKRFCRPCQAKGAAAFSQQPESAPFAGARLGGG